MIVIGVMIFYGPFHRYRLSVYISKKIFEQDNEILPESLKLSEKEAEENMKKKMIAGKFHGILKSTLKNKMKNANEEHEEKKRLVAKTMIKNSEENFEFLDEIKTNLIINGFMKKSLTDFQAKLLPLAAVNKMSKEVEKGLKRKRGEKKDIVEVLKKFKAREIGKDECEEVKKIRKFILENTRYIEEELG